MWEQLSNLKDHHIQDYFNQNIIHKFIGELHLEEDKLVYLDKDMLSPLKLPTPTSLPEFISPNSDINLIVLNTPLNHTVSTRFAKSNDNEEVQTDNDEISEDCQGDAKTRPR
jgi:hypothetical protein